MRDVVAGKNMSAAMRVLISLPADQRRRLAAAHTRGAVGAGVYTPCESTSESQRS